MDAEANSVCPTPSLVTVLTGLPQLPTQIYFLLYEGVSKSFRTESIMKYTLTAINTR
jgi:hypothetical protein